MNTQNVVLEVKESTGLNRVHRFQCFNVEFKVFITFKRNKVCLIFQQVSNPDQVKLEFFNDVMRFEGHNKSGRLVKTVNLKRILMTHLAQSATSDGSGNELKNLAYLEYKVKFRNLHRRKIKLTFSLKKKSERQSSVVVDPQQMKFNDPKTSDVKFVSSSSAEPNGVILNTIYGHKAKLSSLSNYFKQMFESGPKEPTTGTLILSELKPKNLYAVINYMYTETVDIGFIENTSFEDCMEMLERCKAWQYSKLNQILETCMYFKLIDQNPIAMLKFCVDNNLKGAVYKSQAKLVHKSLSTLLQVDDNRQTLNAMSSDGLIKFMLALSINNPFN